MKGWRTILFNSLTLVLVVLESSELTEMLPDGSGDYLMMAVLVVNLVLRKLTTTPIGKKA